MNPFDLIDAKGSVRKSEPGMPEVEAAIPPNSLKIWK